MPPKQSSGHVRKALSPRKIQWSTQTGKLQPQSLKKRDLHAKVIFLDHFKMNGISMIHLAFYSKPPTIKKVHKELDPLLRSGHSCCNLINQQRLETAFFFLCRADVVGCVPQQELSNTHKVHNLCNAKERGYDKGPASSSLEESSRTLFSQDLPAINKTSPELVFDLCYRGQAKQNVCWWCWESKAMI